MIGYDQFLSMSRSRDAEERAQAAFLVASALVEHAGPADEHAALFASVIGFLDDSSLKVRAALAYGLLHSDQAPRVAVLALANDAPIVARAVLQHSPVLIDADLVGLSKTVAVPCLLAMANRTVLSHKLIDALFARSEREVDLALLKRDDVGIMSKKLDVLAQTYATDSVARGLLLKQVELPAASRLALTKAIATDLRAGRLVAGALEKGRIDKLFRDALDGATCVIGEKASVVSDDKYVSFLAEGDQINTRVLIHALLHGHALFFSSCMATLCALPSEKAMSILAEGARPALNGMLARSGMSHGLRNLMVRLVIFARDSDLSHDVAARFLVVTELVQALVEEHSGDIPDELADGFSYLNEQNLILARVAARNIMSEFADDMPQSRAFPHSQEQIDELLGPQLLSLPAA